MVCDRNLAREIEPFSFIQTIDIAADPDCSESTSESIAETNNSVSQLRDTQEPTYSQSSALCNRKSQVGLASLQTDKPATISDNWYRSSNENSTNNYLSNVIIIPEETIYHSADRRNFNYYLDRLLVVAASCYLGFVLWWLFISDRALFPLPWLSDRTVTISQADVEFIEYMQQSLEIIDRQAIETKEESSPSTSNTTFVPVFTPAPKPQVNHQSQLPILLPPPPPEQLAAMNPPIAPITIPNLTEPTTTNNLNTSTDTDKNTPDLNATSNTTELAAKVEKQNPHTLVGVMELTENSAALFKIDGITHRVWLGDKVENTDWVLDKVNNQKVTISRQGKSLTLNIGETF